jgi:hypothetical protein
MHRANGPAYLAVFFVAAGAIAGAQDIPLPRPRPPDIGGGSLGKASVPAAARAAPDEGPPDRSAAPPPPSACQLRLADEGAVAQILPPMVGPGECGAPDAVRLEAVVLSDQRRVAMVPAATMRCALAEAVVHWVRTDLASASAGLGSVPKAIENYDAYNCRNRNGLPDEKLSEHGKANALDIRAIRLANGKVAVLTDASVSHEFREAVRKSACERFTTVLGPGADSYHETHVHVDLAERSHGHRMCQWDVRTPEEEAAILAAAKAKAEDARPPAENGSPKPAEAAVAVVAAEAFEAAKARFDDSAAEQCRNHPKGHAHDCAEQSRRSRH